MVFRNLLLWKNLPPAGHHVFARLEYLLMSLMKYESQANFSKRAVNDDPFAYLLRSLSYRTEDHIGNMPEKPPVTM
jgi:hypothetical protein